jgi:hypothetical protein
MENYSPTTKKSYISMSKVSENPCGGIVMNLASKRDLNATKLQGLCHFSS